MSKVKIFLLLVIIGSLCIFYRYFTQLSDDKVLQTKSDSVIINMEGVKMPIYIKAKNWGMAGNHEEIVLSSSNSILSDKMNDYIFFTNEIFYKTDKKHSITIYAPESSISEPQNKNPNFEVIIIGLRNADEVNDYSLNYKKYGLEKVCL